MAILDETIIEAKDRESAWKKVKNIYRPKVRKQIELGKRAKIDAIELICKPIHRDKIGATSGRYYDCLLKEI